MWVNTRLVGSGCVVRFARGHLHIVVAVFSHPPPQKLLSGSRDIMTWVVQLSAALALAWAVAWVCVCTDYHCR